MVDIRHGDARELLQQVHDVDLILTDPPFGISNRRNDSGASSEYSGYSSDKGDWDREVPALEWAPHAITALRPGGLFLSFGTFGSLVPIFLELQRGGMTFQSHITWHKTNPAPSIHRRMLTHSNELILVFSKGAKWTFDYEYSKSITGKQMHNHIMMDTVPELTFDIPAVRRVLEVTRKPPLLCERLVRLFSRPDDLVVDPFAGSGAIVESAVKAGRRAIAMELQTELCDYMRKEIV